MCEKTLPGISDGCVSTSRLRLLADYKTGVDLADRLAHAEWVVAQQSAGLTAAADEIDSLRAMVVTLTQELEHCKGAGPQGIG